MFRGKIKSWYKFSWWLGLLKLDEWQQFYVRTKHMDASVRTCFNYSGRQNTQKWAHLRKFDELSNGLTRYASVNSSCAHPPPGQLRGICTHCQSRGSGISLPKGSPRAFDTHVVSDSKSKRRRFYRKRPVVCHWLACLSRAGPNCGGF